MVADVGHGLMALAVAAAAASGLATSTPRTRRMARPALVVAAAALTGATGLLARAFAVGDYSLVAVTDHSRAALGTYDRIMGLWGGMAGSLLLFTAATAVFAAAGLGHRPHPVATAAASLVVAGLAATSALLADPFATLAIPAVDGAGLTPILEHWAMRVHPPLVYGGLTVLVVPAVRTLAAMAERRLDGRWWRATHPWLIASWGLLGIGMLIGAHWAYVELGWGGFWAWDPVENTALLPWLAVTVALHSRRGRSAALATVGAFGLALLGSALTRSGATSSVHAFAEAQAIGRALAVLLAAVAVAALVSVIRARHAVRRRASRRGSVTATLVLSAVLVVVLAGTVYPLVRAWSGGDRLAVAGRFYSGTLAPVVLVGLVALVARDRRPPLWALVSAAGTAAALVVAGWRDVVPVVLAACAVTAAVGSVAALLRTRRVSELAHAGVAVLLVGVAGTATGERAVLPVAVGEEVTVAGHDVAVSAITTEPGPTPTSTAVVVAVRIDGHHRDAALVAHPDRGVLLAESTLRSTPLADVQVILRDATESRAVLGVNVAPLQQLVWWGALAMVAGGLAGLAQNRLGSRGTGQDPGSSSEPPRRSRWEASNAPSVVEGDAGLDAASAPRS